MEQEMSASDMVDLYEEMLYTAPLNASGRYFMSHHPKTSSVAC
jgi:hypothetical protein